MTSGVGEDPLAPRRGLVVAFHAQEAGLGRSSLVAAVARWLVAERGAKVFVLDAEGGPRGVAAALGIDAGQPRSVEGQRLRIVAEGEDGALLAVTAGACEVAALRAVPEMVVLVDAAVGTAPPEHAAECDLLVQVVRPDRYAVPALQAARQVVDRLEPTARPWSCTVLTPVDAALEPGALERLRSAVREASRRPEDPAWVTAEGVHELPWTPGFGLDETVPEALRARWQAFAAGLAQFAVKLREHREAEAHSRQLAVARGGTGGRRSVFVSYRRAYTRDEALDLGKTLEVAFPGIAVFLDEVSIWPGELWEQRLDEALSADALVLVVIGPQWWTAQQEGSGTRLIDDPQDWCRREVEAALERGAELVPILVQGATMPKPDWLPESIKPLTQRQALSLSGLGVGDYATAIKEKLRPLLDLAAAPDPALDLQRDWLQHYRRWLVTAHDRPTWSLPGIRQRLVEEVYVEVQVAVAVRKRGRLHAADADSPDDRAALFEADLGSERRSLREVLAGRPDDPDPARAWVVLGEPGSGKSTLARHLVRELAEEPAGAAVPVYLPLPLLASAPAGEAALFRLVEECSGIAGSAVQLLERAREPGNGPVWLLLDGLDEVAPEQIGELTARLRSLAANLPNTHLAVFSRRIGYRPLGAPFRAARMQELSAEARRRLLGHWVADDQIDGVIEQLAARPSLEVLCGNPLLLTLIAQLASQGAALPEGRLDLYSRSIDLLLARPQAERADLRIRAPLQVREVLAGLALELQADPGSAWQTKDLIGALRRAGKASEPIRDTLREVWGGDYEQFLQDVASKTGLLEPDPTTRTTWTFAHRQFREFLAAEALLTEPGGWRKRVGGLEEEAVPRWSETLALFCGMTAEPREVLELLQQRSPAAFVKALPEVEGLEMGAAADLLWGFEPRIAGWSWSEQQQTPFHWDGDDLATCLGAWVRQGRWARELAVEWLWSNVGSSLETNRLAWLRWALLELGEVDDARLFAAAGRPRADADGDFVTIPAGRFQMGSPEDEAERFDSEGPVHEVLVPSFELSRCAVTNAAYARFDRSHEPETFGGKIETRDVGRHPVVNVSWWEAWLYCAWVGARLPTEAEWEYACRAETTGPFSFDGVLTPKRVNYDGNYPYARGPKGEYRKRTLAVGDLPANPWGLQEMHGNVWEWCEDRWHANYEGAPDDGSAWVAGTDRRRVLRGGSWIDRGGYCRSAYRFASLPGRAFDNVGFRPARSSH